MDHMRFLPIHKMKPTMRRNCMAMATLSKFCVPSTRPIALDKQPQMMYLRKPKAAQIATARGADNWNSTPGMMLGIFIPPKIVIIAVKIPISAMARILTDFITYLLIVNLDKLHFVYIISLDCKKCNIELQNFTFHSPCLSCLGMKIYSIIKLLI